MRLFLGILLAASIQAADVDGAKINWKSTGSGPSLVLVHGWTGDSSTWDAQVPILAKTFRVITLDLPGHGKSDQPADGKFSMDLFARAIEAVRAETKVYKLVLAGHSMGTPVVIQYARKYPEHVAALALIDGVVAKSENAGVYASLSERMRGAEGLKFRETFIRNMFTKTPPEMQPGIMKMTQAAPEATAVGAMAAMGDPAIWKTDPINIPVLAIYAEKSPLANRAVMDQVFPRLEYVEIPGTDHFLMLEKPAEFNAALMGFLMKLK
jgi:pimeloyl-ACP methyl ester carboxylesterase